MGLRKVAVIASAASRPSRIASATLSTRKLTITESVSP